MKNTLLLLLVFVLLGGGTYWFMNQEKTETKSTVVGWDREFAVKDIDRIQKIFLADRNGTTTTLTRNGDKGWVYNGKYRARPNAIQNLLDAISRVEMRYKPADAAVPGAITALSTHGIKVELYDDEQAVPFKTYYVGGTTQDERGAFMIMENAEQPYVVSIPSWEGNIRFRYSLAGEEWRDRTIFKEDVDNIKAVSIEYPRQKNKSFKIERQDNGDFTVSPFYDITPKIQKEVNQGSVEAFLVGFESLVAEDFKNEIPERDSISRLVPFTLIKLTTTDDVEQEVRLFPIVKSGSFYDAKTGNPVLNQDFVDRYHADVKATGDFMMVQNRVFEKVFWAYDMFF